MLAARRGLSYTGGVSAPRKSPANETTPAPAQVRSLADIRGRYGLAEERFEVLAEGPRDRRAPTSLGRRPQPPVQKYVAVEQSVMGTARLERPAGVGRRDHEPVELPLHPVRWWPLLLGALIAPLVILLSRTSEPPSAAAPASSASDPPRTSAPLSERKWGEEQPPAPGQAPSEVVSSGAELPKPAGGSSTATPTPARPPAPPRNHLPDFPELEEP